MKMAPYELEAWNEYHALIDKYNNSDRVGMYDRVSIHKAFPEILAAFDHAIAMGTYRRLEGKNYGE